MSGETAALRAEYEEVTLEGLRPVAAAVFLLLALFVPFDLSYVPRALVGTGEWGTVLDHLDLVGRPRCTVAVRGGADRPVPDPT